jgi:hypothetical protein
MDEEKLRAVKVFKTVELLQYLAAVAREIGWSRALKIMEECVVSSALRWAEEHEDELKREGPPVERAFDIFYFRHLGLDPTDVEIAERTPDKIVCRWRNFCSVLEACKLLGLDTRLICREVYEKPGRELLKRIDPRLRFSRNYARIRPYTDYCEEIIELAG